MTLSRYLVSVLAVAGSAFAANGCTADTNNIVSQGDADALADCQTVSGDIVLDKSVSGTIRLDGIQQLKGNLLCTNAANLSELSANDLSSIGKAFRLQGVTTLQTLNFPALNQVDTIDWVAIPELSQLSFQNEITQGSNVRISNTGLTSLNGINLQQVSRFDVNNNRYLTSISTQLGNITQYLNIQANGKAKGGVGVEFPNLIWAFNMTFRETSNVSIPSLSSVNQTLGFFDNSFDTLAAPNLTHLGKDLSFVANNQLTNISIPGLSTVGGGYTIANNTKLMKINGFQKLKTVTGAINFHGSFSEVDLPSLNNVVGGFTMLSTGDIKESCDGFDKLHSSQDIQGVYKCQGQQDKSVATGTSTSQSASSTSKSKSAGNPRYAISNAVMFGVAPVAAMLGMAL